MLHSLRCSGCHHWRLNYAVTFTETHRTKVKVKMRVCVCVCFLQRYELTYVYKGMKWQSFWHSNCHFCPPPPPPNPLACMHAKTCSWPMSLCVCVQWCAWSPKNTTNILLTNSALNRILRISDANFYSLPTETNYAHCSALTVWNVNK